MSRSPDSLTPATVLDFWFDEAVKPLWFNSTPEFDATIRQHFEDLWQVARTGQLNHWQQSAEGVLALVILLDQFPLNMYRGQAKSFASEALARDYAAFAVQQGWDKQLPRERLAFLYMPFMHSESEADQERSVTLFEAAGLTENLKFARHHQELIRRFGRFPHRNAILGRPSRPEELAYLQSDHAFLG